MLYLLTLGYNLVAFNWSISKQRVEESHEQGRIKGRLKGEQVENLSNVLVKQGGL
jgi:hypothetical protein